MTNNSLIIEKRYIFFRDQANLIEDAVRKEKGKIVSLDFSKVIFFSRSFGDEFLNLIENLEKEGFIIKPVNLKPQLKKFLKQIKEKKIKIRSEMK
ncbi:MAG: hypothetical protein Q8N69_02715 [bacterium]|nr:hypothetical protein [bacterium]